MIVNADNSRLLSCGGVCGAIFRKADSYDLSRECEKLVSVSVGETVTSQIKSLSLNCTISFSIVLV